MDYPNKRLKLMKGGTKISCIIPAWNEEKNISNVLEVVKNYPYFDEIIVIDDGSSDNTATIIRKYNQVKLISHKINYGKTGAVVTGVDNSKGDLIVLLDADLIDLTHDNISKLISAVLSKECGMTILYRESDRKTYGFLFSLIRLWGGERAFWKTDFLQMKIPKESGYLLEPFLNNYFIEQGKKIRNIYCPNLCQVYRYQKVGLIKGFYGYLKMVVKLFRAISFLDHIKQLILIKVDHN